MISFLLNDKPVTIQHVDPNTSLQTYVRDTLGLTGTKEGCASGDCGACTLVIAELNEAKDGLVYNSVNSCITLLTALHGKQLITVEHLATDDSPHPVQKAMIDNHGSQCGFCTPGFIMSMFSLYKQNTDIDRNQVENGLSGNLCRCTGYRPIIDSAIQVCNEKTGPDKFTQLENKTIETLKNIKPSSGIQGLFKPNNREELANLVQQYPQAKLVAGATDLGLEITQQLKSFEQLISLSDVHELNHVSVQANGIGVGAGVTLNQALPVLTRYFPELEELINRFASMPIRNQATIGGNVANASPIGDLPPVLLALNASINIDNGEQQRLVPVNRFFTNYRQTSLNNNEWISSIFIPFKTPEAMLSAYKVSKRVEDDISAVCGVFYLEMENDVISVIRTGFGGVAATPIQASEFENQLKGRTLSDPSTRVIGETLLATAFTPLSDVRASAEYRTKLVVNLWRRFWLQHTQQHIQTRIKSCVN